MKELGARPPRCTLFQFLRKENPNGYETMSASRELRYEGTRIRHTASNETTKTGSDSLPLTRDKNYFELMRRLQQSVKGNACADGLPPEFPPDCTTYQITATFIGKINSISQKTFASRKKQKPSTPVDGKGFG